MKFSTLLTGFIACATLVATPAMAANIIATVNTQEIMNDSAAAKSVKEQLDSKVTTFKDEMSKKEAQFNAEEQELRKQSNVLSKDAFAKKLQSFKTKEAAAQKEVQEKRAEIDNAYLTSTTQIQKTVSDIVAEMAKEKGYSAVVPAAQLLWADPTLDITKDVLAKLNTTLPKVTVTFKAPSAAEKAE